MTKFNRSNRTPQFEAAVQALLKLPLEERGRAYAEAEADDLKAAFAEHLTTGRKSWRRLIGKEGKPGDQLPGDDHIELWVNGSELTYESHPYGLSLGTLREMIAACDQHGLNLTVSGASWYFPGSTLCVRYTRANQD